MSHYMNLLARGVGYLSYDEYLKSDWWKSFSAAVRKSGCFCCGAQFVSLQVHHITYKRLGSELASDVVTVCDKCHVSIHKSVSGIEKVPLDRAHLVHKSTCDKVRSNRDWVVIYRLLNKSKKQTVAQLLAFLMEKGLHDGKQPTAKAIRLGFSRGENNRTMWNARKYIRMMMADKKLRKMKAQGRSVPPAIRRLANPS